MTVMHLFSPSGVVAQPAALRLATQRLKALGLQVHVDADARARQQRLAGSDETRLAALHRVAAAAPSIAMATRGGYGLTRLLPHINWKLLVRSVEQGTRWVGHSDFTALHIGLLAHSGGTACGWAGPMATDDFGRSDDAGGVDEVTRDCFLEAMAGELEAVGFRTEGGFDGLGVRGCLWGGNLSLLLSMLGTPQWPAAALIKGGVLFLEDVNEHPYRIERGLLQLLQAGVLGAQKAVVLGQFSAWKPSPLDRGYNLKTVVTYLRSQMQVPVITGLPFGHVPTKVSLPVGRRVQLLVQSRDVLIGW